MGNNIKITINGDFYDDSFTYNSHLNIFIGYDLLYDGNQTSFYTLFRC